MSVDTFGLDCGRLALEHAPRDLAKPTGRRKQLKEALRQVAPGGCQERIRANLAINAFAPAGRAGAHLPASLKVLNLPKDSIDDCPHHNLTLLPRRQGRITVDP
jgi:hypothetical protein